MSARLSRNNRFSLFLLFVLLATVILWTSHQAGLAELIWSIMSLTCNAEIHVFCLCRQWRNTQVLSAKDQSCTYFVKILDTLAVN